MAPNGRGETSRQSKISSGRPTHFYKIIFGSVDRSLSIPTEFMRKYGDFLRNDKVVLMLPTGASWPVQLSQVDGKTRLGKGWNEFAAFCGIQKHHLLCFRFEGDGKFYVTIFDKTAVEIEYPDSKHGGEKDGQPVDRRSSQVKEPNQIKSGNNDDDEVSLEILAEIPASARSNRRINRRRKNEARVQPSKDDDDSVEFLGHIPASSYRDTKRRKTGTVQKEPEDDDSLQILEEKPESSNQNSKGRSTRKTGTVKKETKDDDSLQILEEKLESSRETSKGRSTRKTGTVKKETKDDDSLQILEEKLESSRETSKGRSTGRSREAGVEIETGAPQDVGSHGHHPRQGIKEEENSEEETGMPYPSNDANSGTVPEIYKFRYLSFRRAKTFTSTNPFSICFMQPTYVSGKYTYLNLEKNFARKNLPRQKFSHLELHVPGERKVWPVLFMNARQTQIRNGWKEFVAENSLRFGGVCVFERVTGTKILNVIIYRNS